jgi:hypothetical protein
MQEWARHEEKLLRTAKSVHQPPASRAQLNSPGLGGPADTVLLPHVQPAAAQPPRRELAR